MLDFSTVYLNALKEVGNEGRMSKNSVTGE